MKELQINDQIYDREVRLIGDDGTQYGVISTREARAIADEKTLDLVKVSVSNNNQPATCKLMNYGKFRYEQQKREKEAKKKQHVVELKELTMSVMIDTADIERLSQKATTFLTDGNKVKVSIRLRGRQQAYPKKAVEVLKSFIDMVDTAVVVEKQPVPEGRIIFTILAPPVKK